MRFSSLPAAAPLLFSAVSALVAAPRDSTNTPYLGLVDFLAAEGLFNLGLYVATHGYPSQSCTLENVAVRREWSTLSSAEKTSYINAVQCLASKPSITPASLVPGARSRYDDFVATHINQTLTIHGTVRGVEKPSHY